MKKVFCQYTLLTLSSLLLTSSSSITVSKQISIAQYRPISFQTLLAEEAEANKIKGSNIDFYDELQELEQQYQQFETQLKIYLEAIKPINNDDENAIQKQLKEVTQENQYEHLEEQLQKISNTTKLLRDANSTINQKSIQEEVKQNLFVIEAAIKEIRTRFGQYALKDDQVDFFWR